MKHLSVVTSLSWFALLLCESELNHLDLESIVVSYKMGSNGIEMPNFDSKPLNGLRGLASLHVLMFHALVYTTKQEFYIYGNVSFFHCNFSLQK